MKRRRQRLLLLAAVALVSAALGALLYETNALRALELDSVDARFGIRGEHKPQPDVVVVAIDDITFSEMGIQWPFPRRLYARLIDRIRVERPKAIAFDLQFTEGTKPKDDFALYDAVSRARPVVLATTEVTASGETKVLGGDHNVRAAGARVGMATFPTDADGVIRRMPRTVRKLRSFALITAETASHRHIDGPVLDGRGAWIDFPGPPKTITTIPFSRAVDERPSEGRFRGKIVIVGATAPSLQDVHATSAPGSALMAGPEIQAAAVATALNGFPLRDVREIVDLLGIVVLALLIPLVSARSSALRALPVAGVLLLAVAVAAQLLFNDGHVLAVVYPAVTLLATSAGSVSVDFLTERRERRRMRRQFSRFVGDQVLTQVVEQAGDDLRLGGAEMDATVLFSDLRGFTTFSDGKEPGVIIEVLNQYLTEMSEAILDAGGAVVAYMGDGIMAVFGAPLAQEDHADRALRAAREMAGPRLGAFNAWTESRGLGNGFRIGVGLNSGPVVSGNVGSERRLEYTALGDTTNVASRLESATKELGRPVVIAGTTYERLSDTSGLELIGELEIRGKREPILAWTFSLAAAEQRT